MGEPEDQKQIFFTNLLLLGFDPISMERKYRIPFNKEMFLLPNKKGFEVIMYFLFSRLSPVQCRDEFRDCWPVNDKKQEQQFRKVSHNWLVQIVKNDPEAVFPRIVASLFLSPGGDRFCELLMYFTMYILIKLSHDQHSVKRAEMLHHPVLTSQIQTSGLAPVIAKAVPCGIVRLRTRFLDQLQHTVGVQERWKRYTAEQVRRYRSLTKSVKDKDQKLRALSQTAMEKGSKSSPAVLHKRRSGLSDYDYDIQSVKRAQKVQKVRDMWRALEEFRSKNVQEQEIVDSILEGTSEKYKIDASELNVKVPDLLLRECEQEIHRRGVDNIYQGGQLNLLSLLHLWNMSLHLYIEKLHKAGVPSFEESVPSVHAHVLTHNAHLTNIQAFRLKFEMEVLPQLKDSINKLKEKFNSVLLKNRSPDSIRTTSVGLGLLPPTPPISFEPAEGQTPKDSDTRVSLTHNMNKSTDHVSTPEAAIELMNDVSQKVRLHQNSLVQGSPVYGPRIKTVLDQKPQTRPLSKLPVKGKVLVEKVGTKQRTRFRSAPGGNREDQEQFTAPVAPPDDQARTTLESRLPTSHRAAAAEELGSRATSGPQHSEVDSQGFKVPQVAARARKPSSRSQRTVAPVVVRHIDGATRTPQAHRVLVNKIADLVLGSGSGSHDDSPLGSMDFLQSAQPPDTEAFQSRDKLSRTPASSRKTTWRDSLLHDSVGPLSSTRVDHSDRQPMGVQENDQVVTKLFSQGQSDSEDHIGIGRTGSDARLPSTSGDRVQYTSDLARVRATSPLGEGPPSSISSISPRSDISSVRNHGNRQSTMINDVSMDRGSARTLTDENDLNFLLEENHPRSKRHDSAASWNNTLCSDGYDVEDPSSPHKPQERRGQPDMSGYSSPPRTPERRGRADLSGYTSPPRTPEQRGRPALLGYVSPFGKTPQQREAAADSLVEEVMSQDNSLEEGMGQDNSLAEVMSQDNSLENLLSSLQPAQEIYQSMLDTKTPCLPTRGRKARVDPVSSIKDAVLMNSFEKQMAKNSPRREARNVNQEPNGSLMGDNTSDKESSDIEDSVRVIKFQNGSFTEFVDRSPAKRSRVRFESSRHKSTSPEKGFVGVNDNASLNKIKEQLDNETDLLIARYKQLKVTALNDSGQSEKTFRPPETVAEESFLQPRRLTEKDVIRGGKKPKPLPLIANTPTMSFTDSYLKTSPPGGKYGDVLQSDMSQSIIVKKFTLDLDSEDETDVSSRDRDAAPSGPTQRESFHPDTQAQRSRDAASPAVTREEDGEEEDVIQHDSPGILDLQDMDQGIESFHLGPASPVQSAVAAGFSSLQMSPYTDMIHQHTPSSGRYKPRTNTWDSLLRDSSFNQPSSPLKSTSVPVGNLLDL